MFWKSLSKRATKQLDSDFGDEKSVVEDFYIGCIEQVTPLIGPNNEFIGIGRCWYHLYENTTKLKDGKPLRRYKFYHGAGLSGDGTSYPIFNLHLVHWLEHRYTTEKIVELGLQLNKEAAEFVPPDVNDKYKFKNLNENKSPFPPLEIGVVKNHVGRDKKAISSKKKKAA